MKGHAAEHCRVDWGEMSSRLLGIRMSLSDFPSLVTFKDAAFRLISRWMLLVNPMQNLFHIKRLSFRHQRYCFHKGFFPTKPLEKEIQRLYLICHTKRKFGITVRSIRTFFFFLRALIIFWNTHPPVKNL